MAFWVFILTVWGLVRWWQMRTWRQKDDERFARAIDALNRGEKRFEALEKHIRELEHRGTAAVPATEIRAPSIAPPPPPKPAEPPPPLRIPPWPTEPSEAPQAHPKPPAPATPPLKTSEPAIPSKPLPIPPPATPLPPSTVHPSALPLPPPPKFAQPSAREFSGEFERKLGANWLNKIGITILVIGISLFLAIKFPSLTNPEKIGLGYLISLGILGTGIWLEKKDRYRIFPAR